MTEKHASVWKDIEKLQEELNLRAQDGSKIAEENQNLEIEIFRLRGELNILKEKSNTLNYDNTELRVNMEKVKKQVWSHFYHMDPKTQSALS